MHDSMNIVNILTGTLSSRRKVTPHDVIMMSSGLSYQSWREQTYIEDLRYYLKFERHTHLQGSEDLTKGPVALWEI